MHVGKKKKIVKLKHKHKERRTDRQTDIQIDKQKNRQRKIKTGRQKHTQTELQTIRNRHLLTDRSTDGHQNREKQILSELSTEKYRQSGAQSEAQTKKNTNIRRFNHRQTERKNR